MAQVASYWRSRTRRGDRGATGYRRNIGFAQFRAHLEARDRSPHSIRAYLADLHQLVAWFAEHTGEPFTLEAATEYGVRAWRDHLAGTVNRKLGWIA